MTDRVEQLRPDTKESIGGWLMPLMAKRRADAENMGARQAAVRFEAYRAGQKIQSTRLAKFVLTDE